MAGKIADSPRMSMGGSSQNPRSILAIKREISRVYYTPDHQQGIRCKALLRPFDKLRTGKLRINSSDD
jgi:hypothetical protein